MREAAWLHHRQEGQRTVSGQMAHEYGAVHEARACLEQPQHPQPDTLIKGMHISCKKGPAICPLRSDICKAVWESARGLSPVPTCCPGETANRKNTQDPQNPHDTFRATNSVTGKSPPSSGSRLRVPTRKDVVHVSRETRYQKPLSAQSAAPPVLLPPARNQSPGPGLLTQTLEKWGLDACTVTTRHTPLRYRASALYRPICGGNSRVGGTRLSREFTPTLCMSS